VITDEIYAPTIDQTIAVVKIERIAISVNELPREALKVSNLVCLRARGIASALARSADRQMMRRKQATRREEDIAKRQQEKGKWKDVEIRLNQGE